MKPDSTGKVKVNSLVRDHIDKGTVDPLQCSHISSVRDVTPSAEGCEECLKMGDRWVFLRICLTCGHVGCCDNSKNKHATRHFHETKHPIVASYEVGESWLWCYTDEMSFQL